MSGVNTDILKAIANATVANAAFYVTRDEGLPLLQHVPPLIQVNMDMKDPNDATKVAAKVTDDGAKYLAALGQGNEHTKPVSTYAVQSGGLVLPKIERKGFGGGAPTKYPFDTMEVGSFFFVANADVNKGDAAKTMGSAAGSANQRYAVEVKNEDGSVKTKQVTRAKRDKDNKAIKDPQTGKNVTETVTLPVKRMTRKFIVRPVKAGVKYGDFTAPADGAVIQRIEPKADDHTA